MKFLTIKRRGQEETINPEHIQRFIKYHVGGHPKIGIILIDTRVDFELCGDDSVMDTAIGRIINAIESEQTTVYLQ